MTQYLTDKDGVSLIFTVDVQYQEQTATAAGLLFPHWDKADIAHTLTKEITAIAPYEPGFFYKRELPCILSLLEDVAIHHPIAQLEAIVVDGFVTLGEDHKPGLGMYLYDRLNHQVPVMGVAKRQFFGTPKVCEVYRGQSQSPLFVTAQGMDLEQAKAHVKSMHGDHRLPTLLKRVDQICRGIVAP